MSHSKVTAPKIQKTGRQPHSPRIAPPASTPTAGPKAIAAATAALAIPRRSAGTSAAKILVLPGKAILSPSPRNSRRTTSDISPPAKPVSAVLIAQIATPSAKTR